MSQSELPFLREELQLLAASPNRDGSPAWMVHDPVNNRFFRIGWLDFELLLRWPLGSKAEIAAAVSAETTLQVNPEDIDGLSQFLRRHCLVQTPSPEAVSILQQRATQLDLSWYQRLLSHFLFFRIPLIHPQFWLARLSPRLAWLYTRTTGTALVLISLLGIFLALRQWDIFAHTFIDNLSWSGLLGYAGALVVAKALHEAGHALTATRYGVRVAHMGVAMLAFFPMLYTDTSESWKLSSARQRLAIASAGIMAELALAGIATLAWSIAPDGPVRSALFYLATSSWVLSLLINTSPFMRFDGYFILCDLLDFPNLHERSSAQARTWLRRTLLGIAEPWPEHLPRTSNIILIIFAMLTWLYRLGVFLGAALLVYHFFFKLLGIALFIVEIVSFVIRPIYFELRDWLRLRHQMSAMRQRLWWLLPLLLLASGLIPWPTHVASPGWVHASLQHTIHAPFPGRVVSLPGNGPVDSGQVLFVLESPDLNIAAYRAHALANARARELTGLMGLPEGESQRNRIQQQQEHYLAEERSHQQEQQRLQLTAPFAGTLHDLDEKLAPGAWVNARQALATVIDPAQWLVDVYVNESEVAHISPGHAAQVRVEGADPYFLAGRVSEVDTVRTSALPHPILDAQRGGPLATIPVAGGEPVLRDALYRVRITLEERPLAAQMALARVVIAGDSRAWLWVMLERSAALLIRESGF